VTASRRLHFAIRAATAAPPLAFWRANRTRGLHGDPLERSVSTGTDPRHDAVATELGGTTCATMHWMVRVVLDTSVLVAGLRSRRGASFELISRVGSGMFEVAVSVPLVLEYEDALLRQLVALPFTETDVRSLIDYVCDVAIQQAVFFLWRPLLRDPGDDLVLELAVAARCEAVVTHNVRDFQGAEKFGVEVLTPGRFLQQLRGKEWVP
jgi:predicted nucleic acid-binding protein